MSQQLIISLPTDPETKEYVANVQMVRQSGTLENWKRVNHAFVTLLRRHFLYWRAVGPAERAAMFVEARELLQSSLLGNAGFQACVRDGDAGLEACATPTGEEGEHG